MCKKGSRIKERRDRDNPTVAVKVCILTVQSQGLASREEKKRENTVNIREEERVWERTKRHSDWKRDD